MRALHPLAFPTLIILPATLRRRLPTTSETKQTMSIFRKFFNRSSKGGPGSWVSFKADKRPSIPEVPDCTVVEISDGEMTPGQSVAQENKAHAKTKTEVDDLTAQKFETVLCFMDQVMNGHNPQLMGDICSPGCEIIFDDNYVLTLQELEEETKKFFASLPDFSSVYDRVEAMKDGTVVVRNVVCGGTHTGAPFAFGPCEPLPPSGKKVTCDKEEFHFILQDGKIAKLTVVALGEMTGMHGIYTLLGGFPMV
jgi:SnoaL-like polyketide cyclase